jgi:hypothetical protein
MLENKQLLILGDYSFIDQKYKLKLKLKRSTKFIFLNFFIRNGIFSIIS